MDRGFSLRGGPSDPLPQGVVSVYRARNRRELLATMPGCSTWGLLDGTPSDSEEAGDDNDEAKNRHPQKPGLVHLGRADPARESEPTSLTFFERRRTWGTSFDVERYVQSPCSACLDIP